MNNLLNIKIHIVHSECIPLPKNHLFMLLIVLFLIAFAYFSNPTYAQDNGTFREVIIESPFYEVLNAHRDFMDQGGAQIFEFENDEWFLIGIAKFSPSDEQLNNIPEITRIGEIQAKARVLEFIDGVEVSNERGTETIDAFENESNKMISLEAFFQSTKTEAKGQIQQLPVIGTWWAKERNIFYVAVGTNKTKPTVLDEKKVSDPSGLVDDKFPVIKGDPFFITLLRAAPVLRKNGGVRCFDFVAGRKVIVSVASTQIKDSRVKAKKIARMKAIRSLLGQQNGVEVSSIEYLTDTELLQLKEGEPKRVLLSNFFSIQKEQVSGFVQALPVVVEWEDENENLYIAVGK